MGRHTIFVILALTIAWCVLMEGFTWQNAAVGMLMSMVSLHFVGRFFHFKEISNVQFIKLAFFPFWLVGRVYVDALGVVKAVLGGSNWGIMHEKLTLKNELLRIILSDSITLTPGSVYIERRGEDISLLCLGGKNEKGYDTVRYELHNIERMLQKAELDDGTIERGLF